MGKISDLRSQAAQIRDASQEKENTALRVGKLFDDTLKALMDVLPDNIADITATEVNATGGAVNVTFQYKTSTGATSSKTIAIPEATDSLGGVMSAAMKRSLSDLAQWKSRLADARTVVQDIKVNSSHPDKVQIGMRKVSSSNPVVDTNGKGELTTLDIPAASESTAGVMHSEDKQVINKVSPLIPEVVLLSGSKLAILEPNGKLPVDVIPTLPDSALSEETLNKVNDAYDDSVTDIAIQTSRTDATLKFTRRNKPLVSTTIPTAGDNAGLMSHADKVNLNNLMGVANGATLDGATKKLILADRATGKLPDGSIPARFNNVTKFFAIVKAKEIEQNTPLGQLEGEVCFEKNTNQFVFKSGSRYYQNFLHKSEYALSETTLYITTSDSSPYHWDGNEMRYLGSMLSLGYDEDDAFPGAEGKELADDVENIKNDIKNLSPLGNDYNVTVKRIELGDEGRRPIYDEDGETVIETTIYDTLETAIAFAASKDVIKAGMHLTFAVADKSWKTYTYTGLNSSEANVQNLDNWQDIAGLSAGTEAMVNINVICPDGGLNGFYSLGTALLALRNYEQRINIKYRKKNLVITYRTADGESETKQYKGDSLAVDDFYREGEWEDFGKGSLNGVKVNGVAVTPAADGTINIDIPEMEVDETLDETSTRPVQNATIAAELRDRKAVNVTGLEILGDADNGYQIKTYNADGEELDSVNLPVSTGGGGGGEQTEGTKIVLNAEITDELGTPVETIREGSPAMLRFVFGHQYSTGDNTGQETGATGDLTITVKNGITVTHEVKYPGFGAGSGELDITNYLRTGNNSVTVFAVVDDPVTGTERRKQVTPKVTVRRLSLSSAYDMQNSIRGGGYRPDDTAVIPFNCVANGKKDIHVVVDGVRNAGLSITGYSATSGEIRIPMTGLALGRHNVQIYATQTLPDLELQSETIFIDLLKQAAVGTPDAPFIGTKMVLNPGTVLLGTSWQEPTITTPQYARLEFDFVAYDPDNVPAVVAVKHNGVQTQSISATRQQNTYTNRFTEYGRDEMQMVCGDTTYDIHIDVLESSIDISEVKDSVWFSMNAAGRSNSEQNPGQWTSGDVTTTFENFDWLDDGSGWNTETLKLMNGAKATIDVPLLQQNATTNGLTFECELRCTNIVDRTAPVVDCMDDNGIGFRITAEEARATMDGGESVSTKYASGEWIRVAFAVEKSTAERRLLSLYVNGVHDRVCRFDTSSAMLNSVPGIQILSDAADVEMRSIRVYNRCLTADEIFQNYCAGRVDTEEMILIFDRNDVLTADLDDIDIEKMRQKGKGILRIIGNESDRLSDLVYRNDKSFQMRVTLEYFSPWGKEYNFRAENALIQIQGTSSVTYPRKNWDILFDSSTRLYINGILSVDNKYSFKPGARPVSIFCLKADYCDSSSTHNTGACKTINDVFKRCGWLTPPQQWAQDHSNPYDVRTGIDSFPITLYNDNEGAGEAAFIGKYNFNNEKKGSGIVYGFEGIEGFNDAETLGDNPNPCICLEFLENGQPLNLFQNADMTTIVDPAKYTKAFDKALEFRFPTKPDGSKIKWDDATPAQENAINRLWKWIVACKNDPSKFREEYTNYFGNDAPFAQYVFSDYFMAVDDRAKNMMLATWDGQIWYFLPYDWDCLFGVDNTSHLKYDYDIDEDSFDSQLNNYAFAGHDSELWKLVRACPDKLAEVAAKIRANMSVTAVKAAFSTEYKDAWCERIYNADEKYKYIDPAFVSLDQQSGEAYGDYLFALQGTRESHRNYIIDNRFALLDSLYGIGDFRGNFQKVYLYGDFSGSNARDIVITAFEKFGFAYGSNNAEPSGKVVASGKGAEVTLTINSSLSANDPQNIYGADRIEGLDMTDIADCLVSSLVLSGCKRLRDLDLTNDGNESLEQLDVTGNRILRSLKVNGMNNIRALDLSKNRKLETLEANHTNVTAVNFATGAVTTSAKLPASIQSLTMTAMPNLTLGEDGLSAVSWENMTTLQVDQMGALNPVQLLRTILQSQDEQHRNLARVKIGGSYTRGDGSELIELLNRGVVGVTNSEKPEVNGTYQLHTVISTDDIIRIQEGIAGINLLIIVEAYVAVVDEVNAEEYLGLAEVDEVTNDNIGDYLAYFNGETYEEWLERYEQENISINDLIV